MPKTNKQNKKFKQGNGSCKGNQMSLWAYNKNIGSIRIIGGNTQEGKT